MAIRVGVVLSGCGYLDGTEITEAVSILVALDRRGAQILCMAPDIPQTSVIDHRMGKPTNQTRNVLEESARIARGHIRDIASVRAEDLDALVFPGGFGAAKNLSNFATEGARASVNPHVARLLRDMHAAKKPIGLACIAPALAAAVLGQFHPRLTIGTDRATAQTLGAMGAQHQDTGPTDICVDGEHRIVTTPCYMNDVGPWTVYQGAEAMVERVLRLTGDPASLIREEMAPLPSGPA
jgi:enhancing lycopene biosynthesis protein 2